MSVPFTAEDVANLQQSLQPVNKVPAFSQDDVARLQQSLQTGGASDFVPPSDSLGYRGLATAINTVPKLINMSATDVNNLFPDPAHPNDVPAQYPTIPLSPAETTGEKAIDWAGNFVPKTAEFLAANAATGGVLGDSTLARMASMGLAGATTSTEGGTSEMVRQGLLGAAFGSLHGLDPLTKLGVVGGTTAANTAYNVSQGQDLKGALLDSAQIPVMGYTGEILNALTGKGWTDPTRPQTPVATLQQAPVGDPNFVMKETPQPWLNGTTYPQIRTDLGTDPRLLQGTQPLLNDVNSQVANLQSQKPESIVAAAVRNPLTGEITTGINHPEAYDNTNDSQAYATHESGFITSTGRFVDREEAHPIALAAKQYQELTIKDISDKPYLDASELINPTLDPVASLQQPSDHPSTTSFMQQAKDAVGSQAIRDRANMLLQQHPDLFATDENHPPAAIAMETAARQIVLENAMNPTDRVNETRIRTFEASSPQQQAQLKSNDTEYIKAVAIKDPNNGKIHEGSYHQEALDKAWETGDYPKTKENALTLYNNPAVQGYTTSKGRFVSREEGLQIAKKTDQFNSSKFTADDNKLDSLDLKKDSNGKVIPSSIARLQLPDEVTYQGEKMGLHAFKDEQTGGNFSVKPSDLSSDVVQSKVDDLRKQNWIKPESLRGQSTGYTPALKVLGTDEILVAKGGEGHEELRDKLYEREGIHQNQPGFIDNKTGEFKTMMQVANERLAKDKAADEIKQTEKNPQVGKLAAQIKAGLSGNMEGGYVSGHLLSSLAGATIGGITGNVASKGDKDATIFGAVVGLGLGLGAHLGIEKMQSQTPAVEKGLIASEKASVAKAVESTLKEGLYSKMSGTLKDLAGQNATGRGSLLSKMAYGFEKTGWLNLPEDVKTTVSQAFGYVQQKMEAINLAMKNIKDYSKLDSNILDRVSEYINGQVSNVADVKALIASGDGMDHDTWLKQDKIIKASKPEIWRLQDSNGNVTDTFHISSDTKLALRQLEDTALFQGLDPISKEFRFAQFGQVARKVVNSLQDSIANALPPDSNLKNIINGSTEQYLTRGYKLFTDPSYWPKQELIEKQAAEVGMDSRAELINGQIIKGKAFTPEEHTEALDKATDSKVVASLQQYEPINHSGQTYMVDSQTAKTYKAYLDPAILRGIVENDLKDKKLNSKMYKGSLSGESSTIDTTLFKKRLDLSPTYRELLGEFKDPVEQIIHTLNRIAPMAKAAEYISRAADLKVHGLPAIFKDVGDYGEYKRNLQNQIDTETASGNFGRVATLQRSMNELTTHYSPMAADVKYGLMKDAYVSSFISDQFKDYTGPLGDMQNPIARGMAKANLVAKMVHSVYNPVSQVANIMQTPFLMAMGRVNPAMIADAWKATTDKSSDLHARLMTNGVLPATHAAGELGYNLNKLVNGEYDSELMKGLKGIHNTVLGGYNVPDSVLRASVYLSAEAREMAKTGLAANHPDVISKALEFTNRRAPNYEVMAPAVKFMRNIPMFNLYVSWTSEMARIAKNMGQDALQGDIHAMGMLGAVATLPYILQRSSEASLSPDDRKEWEQIKNQLPEYARNRFFTHISKDAQGNFHYTDFTRLDPFDDFHEAFNAIRKGDWQGLMAVNPIAGWQNTPAWNIITEQVAGKDLFTGQDFRTTTQLQNYADRLKSFAKEITPSWTPGVGSEWEKWTNIGETNMKTGRTINLDDTIYRTLTGMSYGSYNPQAINREAIGQANQQISLEQEYLKQVMTTGGIEQTKRDRAVQVYQEAVQTILDRYRAHILGIYP